MRDYTVIGIARWVDNGSGKLNGDVILDGAITDEQFAALKAALPDESFIPTDLEDVLGVEVEDCSGERVYTYLRETAAEHHSPYSPGWDEITIDLTDSGVTIDAFVEAMQQIGKKNKKKGKSQAGDPAPAPANDQAVRSEIDARALAWFTARNALAEMNEKTDCGGNYNYCACDDTGENDSCAECGIHGDTHAQMCAVIDAATALVAVLAQNNQITVGEV